MMSSKDFSLEIIVFVTGAVLMIFELTASRILAPYLGSTYVVWTGLIGIILSSLSLGYWLGGIYADKYPDIKGISLLLLGASFSILFTALFNRQILDLSIPLFKDLRVQTIFANFVLFSIPSFFLGAISPYAIKIKLKKISNTGSVSGKLYAIETLGSILGTFGGGFFLIPTFGSIKILLLLSLSLVLLSLFSGIKFFSRVFFYPSILLIALLFVPIFQKTGIIADIDTLYSRILVYDTIWGNTGKIARILSVGGKGISSAVFLPDMKPINEYEKFDLFKYFTPQTKKVAIIGGGALSYPRHFIQAFPGNDIDVVEIDPSLVSIATRYFGFNKDPRIRISHQDGRTFLNNGEGNYNVIILDVFSFKNMPFQLTTKEALQKAYTKLTKKGVVIENLISSFEGPNSKFFRSEYWTFKSTFPSVLAFKFFRGVDPTLTQNIILVGIKGEDKLTSNWIASKPFFIHLSKNIWTKEIPNDLPILTDDFAPVETYIN